MTTTWKIFNGSLVPHDHINELGAPPPWRPSGAAIPIEERDASEVRGTAGRQTAPAESPVYNPAFDVTPAELITSIITERGIFRPPYSFT